MKDIKALKQKYEELGKEIKELEEGHNIPEKLEEGMVFRRKKDGYTQHVVRVFWGQRYMLVNQDFLGGDEYVKEDDLRQILIGEGYTYLPNAKVKIDLGE